METSEMEEPNPLELTLDEVIQLNKKRNQEAEETTSLGRPLCNSTMADESIELDETLDDFANRRNIHTAFGSKPIHKRLGYVTQKNVSDWVGGRSPNQVYALQSVRKARGFNFKRIIRQGSPYSQRIMLNGIQNGIARQSPLTRNMLAKFNQANANFVVRRNGSIISASTIRTTSIQRHSIRRHLYPEIQHQIQSLDLEEESDIDLSVLHDFRPKPLCTNISLHERFSRFM